MLKIFLSLTLFVGYIFAQAPTAPVQSGHSNVKPIPTSGKNDPTIVTSPDTSVSVGYTKEYSPTNIKSEDCTAKNKVEICLKLVSQKKLENKMAEALTFASKACELKTENCLGIYSLAQGLAPEVQSSVQKFLENQCVKGVEACNEVASFYETQKNYTGAINFARKYYLKYQKGNFIKFTYLYGDKNEAYAASLNDCTRDNSICLDYIKTMPDHPHMKKVMEQAENFCKNGKGTAVELSCNRVGTYYNQSKKFEKAYEVWDIDCKRKGAQSCLLLIGSTGIDSLKQLLAYTQLCTMVAPMGPSLANVRKMNCTNPTAKEIPKQLKSFADYELKKAEDEFKN